MANLMTDLATIGIKVETEGVLKASNALGDLARQGPKVEQSMSGIAAESKRVAKSLADLASGSGDGLKRTGESAQKAAAGLNAAGVAAREAVTDTASLARALAGVTAEEEKFIRKLAEEASGLRLSRGEMEAYRAAQRGMSQGTQEIARAMGARIDAIKAEQAAVSGVNDSFIRLTTVGIQALVGSSLVSYTVRATSAMYEASAAAQRLQTTLNYATGGNGTQEIEKIRQTANKLGLEFQSTAIAYGQFQAAARGTALEGAKAGAVFESVAKASAVLGLSAADTSGVLLALQQMISKGTVQSEELRGQLGERLPGAFQSAAKAMGVTTAELGKMLEQGQVVADDFLPKFAAQLEKDFGGAAEKAADRLDAATNRMANSWLTLKQVGGDSGVSEFMAGQYAILTDGMNSVSNAMRMAKAEGDGFWGQMLAGGGQVAKFINPMNAFAYSAQEVGNQLSRAEKELAALEAQGAKKSSNLMLREAYAHADRLVSKLREAKIAQDNLAKGGLADAYTEGMGNSKIIPRQRQNAADIDKYLLEDARQTKAQIREEEIGKARKRNAEMVAKAEGDTNAILKLQAALKTEISNIEDKYAEKKSSTKGVDSQAKAVSDIRARILAEEELIKRLQEHGTAAKGLTEADRLVGKLQEEIAGTTNKRTKANLEGQLSEARAWQEAQKTRTELEKQVKAQADAEEGFRKYIDSIYKTADAIGDMADKQEAANGFFGKSKVAIEQMVLAQKQAAAENLKNSGPWTPEMLAAMTKAADEQKRYTEALMQSVYLEQGRKFDEGINAARQELQLQQYGMSLLGMEEVQRAKLIAQRKSELSLEKQIQEIRKGSFALDPIENELRKSDLIDKAKIENAIKLQGELSQIQDQYVNEQVQKYDQIFSQGFADMLNGNEGSWKSFTKSLTTTFKTQVADQIYQMFARPIVVQLVGSFMGMFGGGGGAAAQAASGGSGAIGMASNAYSMYSMFTGGLAASLGSTIASAGSLFGSSALGAFGAGMQGATLGVGMMGPTTMGAGGAMGAGANFGSMLNAIPGWGWALAGIGLLFGGDIFNGLFGRKLKESGVEGTFGGDSGFEGRLYKYYKGGLFRSNKTTYEDMPEEMRSALGKQFLGMDESIRAMAGAVGLGGEALDGFTAKIKVNLKGLSEEEATKKLQEEFQKIADQMGALVLTTDEYTQAGETQLEALTRLSTSITLANEWFKAIGDTLYDVSLAGADMASELMDAFGGADKFAAATSNYYDKFYTDQEKVANQTRLLNEALKKLGVESMPTSRDALREYINGIDLSTEAGRKLYAAMIGLADSFDVVYTSAENIAAMKEDLNVQLLRAQGKDDEATKLERAKQLKELEKYKDPELVRMQVEVWNAEDKAKSDAAAKQAAEDLAAEMAAAQKAAKDLAMKNLEAAVSREKEYWNQFSADAKDSLTKASSYFDLVTNAAKSLRDSVEDSASWSAAAGMVYIEQALDRARKGGGLSDLDATKSAIEAATGGLVMDNYATQAELDYDKKVLAGQLDELGGYAELAKSDAQKQIDLANAQIKRLDDTLTFWKEYGEEQVDATMSVTDAVNALYKLLDPKEQERIRQEEAAKAGLGGGSTPGYTPTGGGSLGGTVAGSNRVTVVGLTADGRAIFSNGEIGQTPAGQTSYNSTGQMNSNGYSLAEFERFKTSGEFEWDPEKNQWRKRASFAIGTNYVPRDMTANIHQGERIIPAADNRALMAALNTQGGGNAELVQEVKALRAELQAINANTAAGAEYGRRTSSDISQVTEGGNAMRVANMA
ncbi:tape measure protein [Comamonas sp. MYb69]|uniref:tape measure protein n=1 Tax=Comamonas sp. MYb69 TaxID=1848650 RepID=UPI0030B21B45